MPLGTTRDGNTFSSDVDTNTLAPGTYEFEVVVHDAAGNTGIGTTYADGTTAPIIVVNPPPPGGGPGGDGSNGANGGNGSNGSGGTSFQSSAGGSGSSVHCFGCGSYPAATIGTKLTAGLVSPASQKTTVRVTTKCRKSRKRSNTKCKKRTRRIRSAQPERLVGSRVVAFGQGASVRGKLSLADGTPLASQRVDIYEKLDASGAKYAQIDSLTTDAQGAFRFSARPGPSRTLGLRYDGDHDRKASEATVKVLVPGSSTLKASRHRSRNGQSVTFSGRVLGQPLPARGKLVDLQAFYRGKWRSFAAPRANKRGQWQYRYRFGATRGTVKYRFRAHVVPEAAYPYAAGYSKEATVTVQGR